MLCSLSPSLSLEARRRAKSVGLGLEHARDVAFRFLVAAGAEEADDVGRSINHLTTVVVSG